MWDVFISYSRKDLTLLRAVAGTLQSHGIHVWTDENLVPGTPVWELEIGRAIEDSRCMLVLMTPNSKTSEWVLREISFARTHMRYIIPVLGAGEEHEAIPISLSDYQRIDLRSDFPNGIKKVAEAISKHIKRPDDKPLLERSESIHATYQLSKFEVLEAPNGVYIRTWGSKTQEYVTMLINAFPDYVFDGVFSDRYRVFDYGTILRHTPNEDAAERIRDLLKLFHETIYIDDYLEHTFALDYHTVGSPSHALTNLGETLDKAKISQDETKILDLVKALENFILQNPTYTRSDMLVTLQREKPFSVAVRVTDLLCQRLGIPDGTKFVKYVKRIHMEERSRTDQAWLHGNFEIIDPVAVQGKLVTIVDDTYVSGTHLNELALTLQEAGATVQGLVITKVRSEE